jgi:ubiquinone/menaquinone biosynthesis C-methylase UbiE
MSSEADPRRAEALDPLLTSIAGFFDQHGDLWIDTYRDESEAWHEYFPLRRREKYACALIAGENRDAAIDLGCGTGHALLEMKRMGFRRIVGVDISTRMLESATALLAEHRAGDVELYHADVCALTMIEDESVDACTALGLIEYLDDDGSLLREVDRILKPGGAAVIQTRNYPCIRTRTVETAKRYIPYKRSKIAYREHKPEVFRREAEAHGFVVEDQIYAHFYALFPLTSVPGVKALVRPVDNYLSKKLERRLLRRPECRRLASMSIVKLRKAV